MRLILSFLFLFTVYRSAHSNTIYRKYRELDVPVVPSNNDELNNEKIVSELKKDQIPVHIEIVEPVVIIKEELKNEQGRNVEVESPIVSARNVEPKSPEIQKPIDEVQKPIDEVEPAAALVSGVVEAIAPVENLKNVDLVESIKSEAEPVINPEVILEPEAKPLVVEQSRSVDSVVEIEKSVEPVIVPDEVVVPVIVNEIPEAVETLRKIESSPEISIESVVADIVDEAPSSVLSDDVPEPSVRNIENEILAPVKDPVVIPVVVPVEISDVSVESLRNVETAAAAVSDVLRKVEEIEDIAEKQAVLPNEIIIEEPVRLSLSESLPKEELRSIEPVIEEKAVVEEKLIEKKEEVAVVEEVKPKEEIELRSVEIKKDNILKELPEKAQLMIERLEVKTEEKKDLKKVEPVEKEAEPFVEIPEVPEKNENVLRVVEDAIVPKVDEKIEKINEVISDGEVNESVRQNAESTTPTNVIQQFLQTNPLTTFIQSIRPQSAASTTLKPQSDETNATPTPQPPNFIQQIATGLQGFQSNVQGLFTGQQVSQSTDGTTARPPFAFITNLFPGQQQQTQSGTNPPTGGNVPPNPIQGFLGLFNGNNRVTNPPSTTTTTTTTTLAPTSASVLDDKVDEVREEDENLDSDPEIYVGDEDNSAPIY